MVAENTPGANLSFPYGLLGRGRGLTKTKKNEERNAGLGISAVKKRARLRWPFPGKEQGKKGWEERGRRYASTPKGKTKKGKELTQRGKRPFPPRSPKNLVSIGTQGKKGEWQRMGWK